MVLLAVYSLVMTLCLLPSLVEQLARLLSSPVEHLVGLLPSTRDLVSYMIVMMKQRIVLHK